MARSSLTLGALLGLTLPGLLVLACDAKKSSGTAGPSDPSSANTAPSGIPSATPPPPQGTPAASSGDAPRTSAPPRPGEMSLPPADGGVTNNASPDASHDRGAAELGHIIQKHRDRFRSCYEQALGRSPSLAGAFVLLFTLNPDGSFKSVSQDKDKSDIRDDAMAECMISVVKGLSFPPSARGRETTMSYPFDFKPKASAR